MYYAIIAAGEGSRLKNEGITTPKPLVCIDGTTLIERLIAIFRARTDCESVSVIINPEVAACAPQLDADNVVVASTPGSMHSLKHLAPYLKGCGRFCLTTVDTVFSPTEFDRYMHDFLTDSAADSAANSAANPAADSDSGTCDGYMGVTSYIDDEKPLYVSTDAAGIITGYFDTPVKNGLFDTPVGSAVYISGGIYTLPESALDIMDECMAAGQTRMRDLQRALVASGMRLRAWPFSCIIDIDHASDIDKAALLISATQPPANYQPLPHN